MERNVSIDVAKGICIILVVIGHLLQFDCSGLAKNTLFNYIYAFHMSVFMMLSGYVASYGNYDVTFTKLILRRFRQLMVPFLVWMVLTIVYWHTSLVGAITLAMSFLKRPDVGAWFLLSLFFIYLYFLLAKKIAKMLPVRNAMVSELITLVGMLVLMLAIRACLKKSIFSDLCSWFYYLPDKYYVMFTFGYMVAKYKKSVIQNPFLLILSVVIFALSIGRFHFSQSSALLQLTVSIPASILMINLSSSIGLTFNGNVNWLMTFGKYSIVIYLVHLFFVHSLYGGAEFTAKLNTFCLAGLCLIFAIPICFLCVWIGKTMGAYPLLNELLFGKIRRK